MKQSEIKNLSAIELQEKINQTKKQHEKLRLAHSISPIENPLQIRSVRRTVARLVTELTNRGLQ